MRLRTLAPAVLIALLAAVFPVAPAQAVNKNCFGKTATIVGTGGDDVLTGTPRADVIVGGSGDDVIKGRGGNDLICGGFGEDEIRGGGGRDRLGAGVGDPSGRGSSVYGGRGNDVLLGSKRFDGEELYGGPGNDILRAFSSNRTYEDVLYGGPGNDVLKQEAELSYLVPGPGDDIVDGGADGFRRTDATAPPPDTALDYIDFTDATGPVDVDLAAGTATGEGSDQIAHVEVVIGSAFDDTLAGGGTECCIDGNVRAARNYLYGGEGHDVLAGGSADDCLVGDAVEQMGHGCSSRPTGLAGNDTLLGGGGDDVLFGYGGDDQYVGGPGADLAGFSYSPAGVMVDLGAGQASGDGADRVEGIETVLGSASADVLIGDEGDNRLDGLRGSDILQGAGGHDTLVAEIRDQAGTLTGGDGSDTVEYQCFNPSADSRLEADLASGSDSIGNVLEELENAHVRGCLAILSGDDGPNRLVAGGELYGRAGDDVLIGSSFDDLLKGGDGNDALDAGEGTDTCLEGETLVGCEN